jgi:NitT/TauT family transport system substrate-binding protein
MVKNARATLSACLLLAAGTLAACGGSGNAQSASGGEGEAAKPSFTVAHTGVAGVSSVALYAAIDDLREQGYEIEAPVIAESELVVEGVNNGDFQFSSGVSHGTLIAIQKGAPITWVSERAANEWAIFGVSDIESCEDLDGRRLAIHSEGAVSTAMVRTWIDENCPGIEPEYVIISGSPNRAQALVADQVDASPMELSDVITLQASEGDRFRIIANLARDLPELETTTVYANSDFLEEHPQAVRDLVDAQLAQHERISDDPAYLVELINRYVEDFDPALIDQVAEAYIERGIFDPAGGLTEESVQFTIDFFQEAGIIEPGLEVDQVADFQFLNEG